MSHDTWHTPPELYRLLDAEFAFDLDAACNVMNCLSPNGITEEANALVRDWDLYGPSVYLNPPYSQMDAFVRRAWDQCQTHKLTVVLLIPAYTDPGYWWDCIVPHADEIRFLRGRVSFLEHGQKKESARFPSVIVVFRYRAGELRGSPRVTWWHWKDAAKPVWDTPLFAERSDTGDPIGAAQGES